MGFQPIQGDYFEKPTGLTAEDLLKWDGSALARFAKGSNGQFLGVNGSGNLAYLNGSKDLLFARYGFTYLSAVEDLGAGDILIYDVADELATQQTTFTQTATFTLNSALNAYLENGYTYFLSWEMEQKSSTTNTASATLGTDIADAGNTIYTQSSNTYTTKGGQNTELANNPFIYGSIMKIGQKIGNASYTSYTKNNKVWVTKRVKTIPTTIDSTWLASIGFTGIKYIELHDNGDSVKINNDTDLVFTGSAGQPTTLLKSTNGLYWDGLSDYSGITQVEIVSGNPLIVFEKA